MYELQNQDEVNTLNRNITTKKIDIEIKTSQLKKNNNLRARYIMIILRKIPGKQSHLQ